MERIADTKLLINESPQRLIIELPSPITQDTLDANSSNWKIRDLTEVDLVDVISICCESFPLDYPEYWYKQVVQGKFISYGLFYFNTLTSLLVAEIKYGRDCDLEDRGLLCSDDDAKVVYILSLAVRREYQRRGIATLLLQHLMRIVHAQRPLPKLVFLHVLAQNNAAIAFYEQNGFRYFTTLSSYYQINDVYHDGFTMVCYVIPATNGRHGIRTLILSPKHVCNIISAIIFSPFRLVLRLKPSSLSF